jgi:hypothetical protein
LVLVFFALKPRRFSYWALRSTIFILCYPWRCKISERLLFNHLRFSLTMTLTI